MHVPADIINGGGAALANTTSNVSGPVITNDSPTFRETQLTDQLLLTDNVEKMSSQAVETTGLIEEIVRQQVIEMVSPLYYCSVADPVMTR